MESNTAIQTIDLNKKFPKKLAEHNFINMGPSDSAVMIKQW